MATISIDTDALTRAAERIVTCARAVALGTSEVESVRRSLDWEVKARENFDTELKWLRADIERQANSISIHHAFLMVSAARFEEAEALLISAAGGDRSQASVWGGVPGFDIGAILAGGMGCLIGAVGTDEGYSQFVAGLYGAGKMGLEFTGIVDHEAKGLTGYLGEWMNIAKLEKLLKAAPELSETYGWALKVSKWAKPLGYVSMVVSFGEEFFTSEGPFERRLSNATVEGVASFVGTAAGVNIGAWVGGAIGTAVCPGAGTAVGAFVGGAVGGWAGSEGASALVNTSIGGLGSVKDMAGNAVEWGVHNAPAAAAAVGNAVVDIAAGTVNAVNDATNVVGGAVGGAIGGTLGFLGSVF